MKIFQKIIVVVSLILITACATYQPRLGMTYQEWRDHWVISSNWGAPKLAGSQGNMEVWTLGDGVF